MKTTIKDLAQALGISPKTVSKALNDRGEVSKSLQEKIVRTAQQMNYRPNYNAAALSRPEIRLVSIAPIAPQKYYSFVNAGLRETAAALEDLHCTVEFKWYSSPNAHDEVKRLLAETLTDADRIAGLVIACSYETESYTAELTALQEKNIPVLFNTLAAPGIEPTGMVGLKTAVAGRIAAEYLASVTHMPGERFAIFTGNRSAPVHKGCIDGFLAELGTVGEIVDTYDDNRMAESLVQELFARRSDISGIYVSSYNAVGVCSGLKSIGRAGQVTVIGHDLYPDLIDCLCDGSLTATLFQNQMSYGRDSLRYLYEYAVGMRSRAQCVGLRMPRLILKCMAAEFPAYMNIAPNPETADAQNSA